MFFGSRDGIIKTKIQEEANGDIVSLIHSVERSDIPIPDNTVRLDVWKGQRTWQNGKNLHWRECLVIDLKGYIPKSLMHMASGNYKSKEIETNY